MSALQELRARIGALERKSRDAFPWSYLPEGMPRGALVEITGSGKTEAVARLLAENPLPSAWVEADFSVFPSALLQRQVKLEQVFFIAAGKEAAWAVAAALRSRLFPLLVYRAPYGEERELRRFQLLAERSHATMILLGDHPTLSWPISLSLEMREGRLQVRRKK